MWGATGTSHYAFIMFNMADLTDFRNILLDGLYLVSFASFQTFGNVNKTIKAKGFANDTTGLTLFKCESFSALKQILVDFGGFSGLQ
jgi:hypothetical protein